MRFLDRPSIQRRGAAPPNPRKSAVFLGIACAIHVLIAAFLLVRIRPPREFSVPASGGPLTRARLVRLAPLRTFPSPDAAQPEAQRARPKPALIKRYSPGAKVVVRPERGPAKKTAKEDVKTSAREVTPTPQADLAPRWWSPDSSRSTSVHTEGDFRFAYYLAALRNKIGAVWVPPQGLDAGGRPVRTVLYFRIQRNGQVSLAQVESSSGFAFFDQTALRALLASTPLPPLPAGYTDDYLGVHFGFEFVQ
jgi:TonB family protein